MQDTKNYIESEKNEGDYKSYVLNVSAIKKMVNGQEYTDQYTTDFEIEMEKGNKDKLLLTNKNTGIEYVCYKSVK